MLSRMRARAGLLAIFLSWGVSVTAQASPLSWSLVSRQEYSGMNSDRPSKNSVELGAEDAQPAKKKDSGKSGPVWTTHKVIKGDTLSEIARKFGVKVDSIQRWNKIEEKEWIRPGQKLRILARKGRAQKGQDSSHRIVHVVRPGDRWKEIASHYRVDEDALKKWNQKKGEMLRIGQRLVVWTDRPRLPRPELRIDSVEKVPDHDVRSLAVEAVRNIGRGAKSVGKPNRGRIIGAIRMPQRKNLYTLRDSNRSWGSSHTIQNLLRGLVGFRDTSGYQRELIIHDISRRSGGRLRPHSSHQSGRDVDIRLPLAQSVRQGTIPNSVELVDWKATWHLIHSLIETGEVEYIFLDWSRQRTLYRAARSNGVSNAVIERALQWPKKSRRNNGFVRHEAGHKDHIHVRFRCAKSEKKCVSY